MTVESLTIGSLFSGIGGLELGLERAGLGPVRWQVEIDPFCRAVLAKHWPHARRFDDVCKVGSEVLEPVDVICGGFPCQDISFAGDGAGLAGARSGLWSEYARIVRELRPCFVVVENVAALLSRGLDQVLGTLASFGYDAEWSVLRASDVGAPHRRERLFIIARLADSRCFGGSVRRDAGDVARASRESQSERDQRERDGYAARDGGAAVADDDRGGCKGERSFGILHRERQALRNDAHGRRRSDPEGERSTQSRLVRIPDGVPAGVDRWPAGRDEAPHPWEPPRTVTGRIDRRRLKALGNAVVPQCAELVGRRLLEML